MDETIATYHNVVGREDRQHAGECEKVNVQFHCGTAGFGGDQQGEIAQQSRQIQRDANVGQRKEQNEYGQWFDLFIS